MRCADANVNRTQPRYRPLALVTNDDGYQAPGMLALARELTRCGARVVVVAPETEQSACSHGLTLHRPLRLRQLGLARFALDGTPADCVYVALCSGDRISPSRPDFVVSGVNNGLNLGYDVFYSGTVAAAREGVIRGIPALAASADVKADLESAAKLCARLAMATYRVGRELNVAPLINVNVPKGAHTTLRATQLGKRVYGEAVEFRTDPRGRPYLWIGGPGVVNERGEGTDTDANTRGLVSVSSLSLGVAVDSAVDLALAVCAKCERSLARRM
jgi:5'-nucleotidase